MAIGRALSLGDESQAALALWASKTAIALVAATPDLREFVPRAHRDSVRYNALPHAATWVGYVPWSGSTTIYASDNALTFPGVGSIAGHQSYTVFFAFKRLAFHVVGFIDPLPSGYFIDSGTWPF